MMSSISAVTGFLPRVTRRDGRAIEQALAGQNLFQTGIELPGAVVEAAYARGDPPLLRQLHERKVPYVVDAQTLRFSDAGYLEVEAIRQLPYAPASPLAPGLTDTARLVGGTFDFQARLGASDYLAPAVPLRDEDREAWTELQIELIRQAASANGKGGRERKPLVAFLAPGRRALLDPEPLVSPLGDLPVEAVYVQPLRLNPKRDSAEKLVGYVRFLLSVRALGLPVIAGRVGAFGLVLEALGIPMFDSGLGVAEQFDLATTNRVQRQPPSEERAPRGSRAIYLEALKTTLPERDVARILSEPVLRARFACDRGCCRWRSLDDLASRCREHYLFVRQNEVEAVSSLAATGLRVARVHQQFVDARELARVVTRTLRAKGYEPPRFDHLERWLAALARVTEIAEAA